DRHGGSSRGRTSSRSPRHRHRSYTRSPSPARHDSRDRGVKDDYRSRRRSRSISHSRSPRDGRDYRADQQSLSPRENGQSPRERDHASGRSRTPRAYNNSPLSSENHCPQCEDGDSKPEVRGSGSPAFRNEWIGRGFSLMAVLMYVAILCWTRFHGDHTVGSNYKLDEGCVFGYDLWISFGVEGLVISVNSTHSIARQYFVLIMRFLLEMILWALAKLEEECVSRMHLVLGLARLWLMALFGYLCSWK
ncbi:hypothetical protein H0E87_015221, partial [Populus deltoides]